MVKIRLGWYILPPQVEFRDGRKIPSLYYKPRRGEEVKSVRREKVKKQGVVTKVGRLKTCPPPPLKRDKNGVFYGISVNSPSEKWQEGRKKNVF
ncbi:MAG: hypothetical protein V1927_06080 [Candidatus Omnitrophota bacterium]